MSRVAGRCLLISSVKRGDSERADDCPSSERLTADPQAYQVERMYDARLDMVSDGRSDEAAGEVIAPVSRMYFWYVSHRVKQFGFLWSKFGLEEFT